jgi:uncharacterized membrane protein (DUF2068 family)
MIGAAKALNGLALLCVGVAIFGHLDFNLAEWLTRASTLVHLSPGSRIVHATIAAAARLDAKHLRVLGVAAFAYATLHIVEGIGLLLERRWAGRLTVIATGALIPLEVVGLVRRVDLARAAVLVVNMAIAGYLIVKLRHDGHAWIDEPPDVPSDRAAHSAPSS